MNDILYIIIILVISPTQVDVIYNKVSVAEYKKFETGSIDRKSFANSAQGLQEILKANDTFKGDNSAQDLAINFAPDSQGFMGALGARLTRQDVEAYAKAKTLGAVADKVIVAFVHDKAVKNIGR